MLFLKHLPRKYHILFMIISGIFTIVFLTVATNLTRSGVFSSREYNDVNKKILNYIEQCDANSFKALVSPGYAKRLQSNLNLPMDICVNLKDKNCNSIIINRSTDSTRINARYRDERLYHEYGGNLSCTDKSYYIGVKINEKREVISLEVR